MAILHEPALLVLDEPTTGVDPVSRVSCGHWSPTPFPAALPDHLYSHGSAILSALQQAAGAFGS